MDVGLSQSGGNEREIGRRFRLIRLVRFTPPFVPCDRCQEPARSV